MSVPKSVLVLGKPYTIKVAELSSYGECDPPHCAIVLDKKQHPAQMRDTLLHELLHAVEHEASVRVSEAAIRMLATGILAVLRGNPKLAAYLLEAD